MCEPATMGLLLAAAGTGTQMLGQQSALRRQDRTLAEGLRRQAELQRQAAGRTMEHIEGFGESGPEQDEARSREAFMQALRAAQEPAEGGLPGVPGASPRYAEDVAAGRGQVMGEAGERAGRLATIDAPTHQRLREAAQLGRTGFDVGELGRQSQAQDFLARLRASGQQPNPWIQAAGSLMQGMGTGMAMRPPAMAAAVPAGQTISVAGAPASAAPGAGVSTADFIRRMRTPWAAGGA
jgi:hypothetical protein